MRSYAADERDYDRRAALHERYLDWCERHGEDPEGPDCDGMWEEFLDDEANEAEIAAERLAGL